MTTPLLCVLIILTFAVGLLALYSLGAGRRVLKALTDAPTGLTFSPNGLGSDGPPIGEEAPPLTDVPFRDSAAATSKSERLVLFAEAGCQPCSVLAADLSRRRVNASGAELVAVVDDARFGERFRDEWTVIVDPEWRLAGTWRVMGTPHVTLVDHDGNVLHNTVVNTRKEIQLLVDKGAPR